MASYSFFYLMGGLALVAGQIPFTRKPKWNDYPCSVLSLTADRCVDSEHLRVLLD